MITPDLGLTHFNSIYIILLCSWSYGVLLWEMETGGVSSFLGVFLQSFLSHFILIVLPLSSFLLLLNSICLLRLPKVRMLLQSYARLIFFLFFFPRFCFFSSHFYNQASNHILVWQPPNWCQSWGKATDWKSPTDVQMKCKISIHLFVHSFIYSNVYIIYLIIYSGYNRMTVDGEPYISEKETKKRRKIDHKREST